MNTIQCVFCGFQNDRAQRNCVNCRAVIPRQFNEEQGFGTAACDILFSGGYEKAESEGVFKKEHVLKSIQKIVSDLNESIIDKIEYVGKIDQLDELVQSVLENSFRLLQMAEAKMEKCGEETMKYLENYINESKNEAENCRHFFELAFQSMKSAVYDNNGSFFEESIEYASKAMDHIIKFDNLAEKAERFLNKKSGMPVIYEETEDVPELNDSPLEESPATEEI